MCKLHKILETLSQGSIPSENDIGFLLNCKEDELQPLFLLAREVQHSVYGRDVYIRGLIEFTNYCKNDCYYCGIRRGNRHAERYRLTKEDILDCCEEGYRLGFRTFVLQGGEDPFWTDALLTGLISAIKNRFPDCAVTLSVGEKSRESYRAYYAAGADRFLLRHETANGAHYRQLHPPELSGEQRKQCLFTLKEIGFQVGCGMMVGSPGQTAAHIREDLLFMKELEPHMIGIGPFIPHQETPFAHQPPGTLSQTLALLSVLRILFPHILLPATTALATICDGGRERGILAGANVVMPNLSPLSVRKKYLLYDHKVGTGAEAAEGLRELKKRMSAIGYQIVVSRGDYKAASAL